MKKILLGSLIVLIAIQFLRPARNTNGQVSANDFAAVYAVPDTIKTVLRNACYDCHSNNTRYPWYTNVQPVGWLLAKHIKDGKAALNFNEFNTYSERRQSSKFKAIYNSVKDGSMPIPSYMWLHHDAKLTQQEKALLLQWSLQKFDSLSSSRQP